MDSPKSTATMAGFGFSLGQVCIASTSRLSRIGDLGGDFFCSILASLGLDSRLLNSQTLISLPILVYCGGVAVPAYLLELCGQLSGFM